MVQLSAIEHKFHYNTVHVATQTFVQYNMCETVNVSNRLITAVYTMQFPGKFDTG